jgi:hypothetical protein
MTIILTDAQIELIERAAGLGLSLDDICYLIGGRISTRTLDRRLKDDERAREAYNAGRAKARLQVSEKLFNLIERGEPAAIFFYLKCQAGWREKDKAEENNNKAEIKIYLPEKE